MSAVTSKVQICNLALGGVGNRNTVMNIDTPKTDKEITFAQWYDVIRQLCLKTMMPNFALDRVVVSEKAIPTAYAQSYSAAVEYPNDCLKLLGIGDIDFTDTKKPTVEGNTIYLNQDVTDGAYLRIVRDITDVTLFSPEFVIYFASELASRTALSVTQDAAKKKMAQQDAKVDAANTAGLNAQENKPIRRSTSRFRIARSATIGTQEIKP